MDVADKVVLIVDEEFIFEGLSSAFGRSGVKIVFLDPTVDVTRSTDQYRLRGVIFEPYFFTDDCGRQVRPIIEEILGRAHNQNAPRIALSSQSTDYLDGAGIYQGTHYEMHLLKPELSSTIVNCFLEAERKRTVGVKG